MFSIQGSGQKEVQGDWNSKRSQVGVSLEMLHEGMDFLAALWETLSGCIKLLFFCGVPQMNSLLSWCDYDCVHLLSSPFPLENSLVRTILTECLSPIRELNDGAILYSSIRIPKTFIFSRYLSYTWICAHYNTRTKPLIFLPSVPTNKSHLIISPILKDKR